MFQLFKRFWYVGATVCVAVEAVLVVVAVISAHRLRFGENFALTATMLGSALVFSATVMLHSYLQGLYDFEEISGLRKLCMRLARSTMLSAATLWGVYYVLPGLWTGRGVFTIALVLTAVLILGWRGLFSWVFRKGLFREHVLVIGSDDSAIEVAREIHGRSHVGYRVVGFLDDDPNLLGVSLFDPTVLGTTGQACEIAQRNQVGTIVVAQKDDRGRLDVDHLLVCKTSGIRVQDATTFMERMTGRISLSSFRKSSLVFSEGFVVSRWVGLMKRFVDVVAASTGLLLSAPILLLAAVSIRLDSPGPIFYSQKRLGLNGRPFRLRKLRSMAEDAESAGGAQWAKPRDARVTRVGRILRRFRIDELPQFWSVLIGDMSLVGPRPEREVFSTQITEKCALFPLRLVVRPGLTGWAQVKCAYAATMEDSIKKLQYDLYYIKHLSVLLDLSIMASTVRTAILGRGAQ